MKTFRKKANDNYKIRKIKKGTLGKIDKEVKQQDSRANDIWNRWKDKYEYKGSDKEC